MKQLPQMGRQFTEFVRKQAPRLKFIAIMLMVFVSLVANGASHAASFSIDTSGLLDNAATIFNGLWPAFAIVLGIVFGIGLLKFIAQTIRSVFGA